MDSGSSESSDEVNKVGRFDKEDFMTNLGNKEEDDGFKMI